MSGSRSASCSGAIGASVAIANHSARKDGTASAGNGRSTSSTSCPSDDSSALASSYAATQSGCTSAPSISVVSDLAIRSLPGSRLA